ASCNPDEEPDHGSHSLFHRPDRRRRRGHNRTCRRRARADRSQAALRARGLAAPGLKLGWAARNIDKLAPLAAETGAERFAVDASDPAAVAHLFEEGDARLGAPDVVLYNASARAPGPIAEIDPEAARKAIEISAFGGFLV